MHSNTNPLNKRKIINDPVYGFITIPTDLVFDLIEHPYFQRLSRIRQLGLSYLVYPGAQHTRMQHALGAMHLMGQTLEVLRSKGVDITAEEAEAVTIAILLHDIGHGPFSHTLENLIITGVMHEELTMLMMEKLNSEFGGRIEMALRIFKGLYPKKFLSQLVSSQLDMDRLDYLNRDSFFTGVAEGVIGYDRIIKMLSVYNNELVVEEKGIYSIEKFLVSRRLMYWQVYLHKTVLAAEEMLIQIIKRARTLSHDRMLLCAPALSWFLRHDVSLNHFMWNEEILDRYTELDDNDIFSAVKQWQDDDDAVLSYLCTHLLSRRLFRIEIQQAPFEASAISKLQSSLQTITSLSQSDSSMLIISDTTSNRAYNPAAEAIKILFKNGVVKDVAEASDLLNISALKQPVVKHFLCYPKELKGLTE